MTTGAASSPSQHTVWAMVFLSAESESRIRDVLIGECGLPKRLVRKDLHASIYHARRPILGLRDAVEPIHIPVSGAELRMMSMAPGGENRRPDVDPAQFPIGVRIRRAEGAAQPLEQLRDRFLRYETPKVLGSREPSTRRASAFGARHFQPHITLLRAGAWKDPDLAPLGKRLREHVQSLTFDRLVVRCRSH
ncbi:MAG: hypothetical protein KF777_24460 [Planctomycetaceae bacterium]|nr:hypothetical protein [Planctomycetaceae bacterium]